ncbi:MULTISPECIES: helix-turn-helix domain-containing protein [Parabacteroides]|uniref:helix-turn-helix domain-containing protein n=1 Tax=Parabacteroides TaxID=375288 RepID=UPI00240D10A9|nr:helix-turn-helix domain-containing protein [Parabacteroides chongii]WFE84256.1 helix-turn-helix domain-containing protein [Parabacteroides chongii]
MNEFRSVNENQAIDLMGLSYVKIPRYTLNLIKNPATRQLGQLHLLLFDICFFADGCANLNGRKVPCKRGEYVGTQQQLADMSGINIGSINRLIRKLEAMHLISVTKIQGGSLIKVHGYTSLIDVPEVKKYSQKKKGKQEVVVDLFAEARRLYGGGDPIN